MPVNFKKPPVVEAWVGFRFALTQEDSPWNEDVAKAFVKAYFEDFVPESFSRYAQIRVDAKTGRADFSNIQESFDRIRAFSAEKDRCVQAGRGIFVFNQLNKGNWPGYPAMRDGAIKAASKYMEFRGLNELAGTTLHYLDVVSIPKLNDKGIRFADWFRVYPEVPEDAMGTVSAFRFDVQLPNLCEAASAHLSIRSLPSSGQADANIKFSIDWHVSSDNRETTVEAAKKWLDKAHEALRGSFDKAFTPDCLQLFEPVEGD